MTPSLRGRSAIIEQNASEYVKTERSHGLSEARILLRHVLPNSNVSSITIITLVLSDILGGSLIVEQVFNLPGLWDAARTSVLRTVIGTVGAVMISAFLGYMFTRKTLWHRKLWYRMVTVTMYINAGIIPWFLTMKLIGMTNNFWGYIFPMIIQPFNIVLCKTYVESVPLELQEAAEIDGAGTLTVFFRIMLPVIKPIMATIAVFAAVNQWNAFQDTLLLNNDNPKLYTLQFVLFQYINQASSLKALVSNSTSSTAMMASLAHAATATSIRMTVTVVVVLPIICVYPFFQRFFTKGIMIGAVKG